MNIPKSRVIATQGFLFTINCTRTLSSAGQQQMSSMWHHRISMDIMCHVVTCSCWRCHDHPLSPFECNGRFFFPGSISSFCILTCLQCLQCPVSIWGLSVVGTGGDFLGAGCGWYRIESIAGFDHHLFVTMQHLKSSNINLLYWKTTPAPPRLQPWNIDDYRESLTENRWGFICSIRFPLLLDFPFELLSFLFWSWQQNCRPAVLDQSHAACPSCQDLQDL